VRSGAEVPLEILRGICGLALNLTARTAKTARNLQVPVIRASSYSSGVLLPASTQTKAASKPAVAPNLRHKMARNRRRRPLRPPYRPDPHVLSGLLFKAADRTCLERVLQHRLPGGPGGPAGGSNRTRAASRIRKIKLVPGTGVPFLIFHEELRQLANHEQCCQRPRRAPEPRSCRLRGGSVRSLATRGAG
jgi:hypothetical protein